LKMVEKHLPPEHFNTVIRMIKTARVDVANSIRVATQTAMDRLGVGAGRTRAVKGLPKGSDQVDVGSLVAWLAKVNKEDTEAVAQIVVINVTARVQMEG